MTKASSSAKIEITEGTKAVRGGGGIYMYMLYTIKPSKTVEISIFIDDLSKYSVFIVTVEDLCKIAVEVWYYLCRIIHHERCFTILPNGTC